MPELQSPEKWLRGDFDEEILAKVERAEEAFQSAQDTVTGWRFDELRLGNELRDILKSVKAEESQRSILLRGISGRKGLLQIVVNEVSEISRAACLSMVAEMASGPSFGDEFRVQQAMEKLGPVLADLLKAHPGMTFQDVYLALGLAWDKVAE